MAGTTKVNQQSIAQHLNVSVATVSKALSNAEGVSSETRSRIMKAATELGYKAGKARQADRRNGALPKHRYIGVLARSSYQPGVFAVPQSYFGAIREMATQQNFTLVPQEILGSVDDHTILDPSHQPPALRDGSLSGMLVMGQWSADVVRELDRIAPCVVMPFTIPGVELDHVGLDHNGAVSDLIEHLHTLGHQRIGFFGRCNTLSWSTERFAGFVNGLARLGSHYDPATVIDIAEPPLMEEGHDAAWAGHIDRALAATRGGVTAWVCSSDWPGNQLHRGLVQAGLKVPTDVSITGFDNSEPVTLGMPPLTTTYLPRPEMGKAGVKRLLQRIGDPDAEVRRVQFSCPIVDHGTTAPPRDLSEPARGPATAAAKESAA